MNNTHFKELIESLRDLTTTQKKHLIRQARQSLEESEILQNKNLLTSEELELLLTITNEK
ncbi:hypothetical protein [Vibrio sp. AND4]|uniref:hypothetical protein n=1 Tax=Vibrio sp. AND4 TaxID=314289 RepID=UPI00015F2621|nr:hypothetical protein [Vibrio sp. AND4]EDP57225.1 hypothetical protein AND4_08697 [Vibrio sp. AND4]